MACFPEQPIFVKDIPNGYCSQACCEHLPWFEVTTTIGVFKIGWRKRVIVIDWFGTYIQSSAKRLFPEEDVTKRDKIIHAWSYEKARDYIALIFEKGKP